MRIALVSPSWGKTIHGYSPLGLAYLAAILEKSNYNVKIFDFALKPILPVNIQAHRILTFQPELIGITSLTNTYYSAISLAKSIKYNDKDIPIVMGGPHPTVLPKQTLQEPCVDFVIFGEGEYTLLEFVGALQDQRELKNIKGLAFKGEQGIIINQARPLIDNLDALPFPARHLLEQNKYQLRDMEGHLMAPIMSSRGCPYGCGYCFKGIFGRIYRKRSAENVINELEQIKDEFGIRSFYFIDDLFTFDEKRVFEMARLIHEKSLNITWQCITRVDNVNPQLLHEVRDAGCNRIHVGIESGNQEILNRINKQITLGQVKRAIKWCKEVGIYSQGYFMIGLPGDNEDTIKQTIDFSIELIKLGLNGAVFSLTTPLPGAPLWQYVPQMEKNKLDVDFSKSYYAANDPRKLKVLYNLSNVSNSELIRSVVEANYRFRDNALRKQLIERFGNIGIPIWYISKIKPVRRVLRPFYPFIRKVLRK